MSKQDLPFHLLSMLKEREQKGLLRRLKTGSPPIDFCSNDYLGFSITGSLQNKIGEHAATSPKTGSTGSRLISGNSTEAEELEKKIATFHHSESALLYNSGYDANLGVFSCIPQKNDVILYDEFIHASIHDGLRLSYANRYKFKHNDVTELKELIARSKETAYNIFIAVESVYSMDGDCAPLAELAAIARANKNIYLIVDEAHAIGVFGEKGRGLCSEIGIEKDCFARIYTYGKAMGCHGAAVVGSKDLTDYLINFSRPFIYTTALPLHSVKAIDSAYDLLIEGEEQGKLKENILYFNEKAKHLAIVEKSVSAIQCLHAGSNSKAEAYERSLAEHGIYSKAIKSPTVREGTERLRLCIHAFNTKSEIDQLIKALNSLQA